MRRLSRKESAAMLKKPPGKMCVAYVHIAGMATGDIILLERSDWHQRKRSPCTMIRRIEKRFKSSYRIEILMDGSGWVIERLE
jgi:hypothetical protein